MMEMPVRARRRLEDLAASWQEKRDWSDDLRQQQSNLRRSRITCSASLSDYQKNQDWTGSMGLSPSGRFQIVEEAGKHQRFFTREGIRWDAAWAIIGVICALLAVILLTDLAGIGRSMRNITKLDSRIEILSDKNEELNARLAMSTDDLSVCTEAVKLNLIGSGGARMVHLTVPSTVTMKLTANAGTDSHQSNPAAGD